MDAEDTFKQLLKLCRGDLSDIATRLKNLTTSYESTEDRMQADFIEQGRKMNELREDHERGSFETRHEAE